MAVVDLSLNGLISRNLNLKNLSRYILVIEVHVCRNLEQLAYVVRREDVRRAWDRPKPPKGAHTAPRGAWPKFATKSQNDHARRGTMSSPLGGSGQSWVLWVSPSRDIHSETSEKLPL